MASDLKSSLRFVLAEELSLFVLRLDTGRRRVQGRFKHDGVQYWLWVTDPVYEREYLAKKDGEYHLGKTFLTVSLGEPYNGSCYKLIAAIIKKPDTGVGR